MSLLSTNCAIKRKHTNVNSSGYPWKVNIWMCFFLSAATHPKWSRTQKGRVAIPGIGIFAEAPCLVSSTTFMGLQCDFRSLSWQQTCLHHGFLGLHGWCWCCRLLGCLHCLHGLRACGMMANESEKKLAKRCETFDTSQAVRNTNNDHPNLQWNYQNAHAHSLRSESNHPLH